MPAHTMKPSICVDGELANGFLLRCADAISERIATIPHISDHAFSDGLRDSHILLLTGMKRHGKDTAATVITQRALDAGLPQEGLSRRAFADPLKKLILDTAEENGLPFERAWLYGSEQERETVREELSAFGGPGLSGRRLMQLAGTELGRHVHGDDLWTNAWRQRLLDDAADGVRLVLAPDCRFPSEVLAARAAGATVLQMVRAEGLPHDPGAHVSERPLPEHLVDHRIQCAYEEIPQRVGGFWAEWGRARGLAY